MAKLMNGELEIDIIDYNPVYEILSYGMKSDESVAGFAFELLEVTEKNYPFKTGRNGTSKSNLNLTSFSRKFISVNKNMKFDAVNVLVNNLGDIAWASTREECLLTAIKATAELFDSRSDENLAQCAFDAKNFV
jgi:hypothetical protein